MEVVERDDAVLSEPIADAESQLRRQSADRRCQMRNDDRVDAVGDGVACEDENGPITASSNVSEPDLPPFHWPNTSVQSVSSSDHVSFGQVAVSAAVSRARRVPLCVSLAPKAIEKLADSLVQQITPGDTRRSSGGVEFFGE